MRNGMKGSPVSERRKNAKPRDCAASGTVDAAHFSVPELLPFLGPSQEDLLKTANQERYVGPPERVPDSAKGSDKADGHYEPKDIRSDATGEF